MGASRKTVSKAEAKRAFAPALLAWAKEHGRVGLPWQGGSPYEVWISEIMLQQTRVETAAGYFREFLRRFPTLKSLAESSEDDVLAAWSGLGYYQRAKNLRKAAQIAMRDFGGDLPVLAKELETLPGIGRSTAAAIASSCHNERVAILDANAKRSIARAFAVKDDVSTAGGLKKLWDLAESLVPEEAAAYTQAIMDLGATVCLPAPRCAGCPIEKTCLGKGSPERFPGKRARSPKEADGSGGGKAGRPERFETWLLAHDGVRAALRKREDGKGVWRGLLAFPESAQEALEGWVERETVRHDFSHYRLFAKILERPMEAEALDDWAKSAEGAFPMAISDALEAGIPSPVRRVLESLRSESDE